LKASRASSPGDFAQLKYIVDLEVRQFFRHPRCLHAIPLLAAGTIFSAWVYPVASPFVPVIIVTIGVLELQFNNIFFRSPNELPVLNLYPVRWRRIILAKNIATMILGALLFLVGSMALLYFYPAKVTGQHVFDAIVYILTVVFPLLHLGNMRSIAFPRPANGFRVDDFVELVWILVTLAVLSVPYFFIIRLSGGWALCALYASATALYWHNVSLRKAGDTIEKETAAICSSI